MLAGGSVAAAALALLCACGSGSTPTPTPSPTPRSYAARANAICASASASQAQLGPGPQFSQVTAANLASASAYLARFLPILDDTASRLGSLGAAGRDPTLPSELVGRLEAGIASLRRAQAAAAAGDPTGFRAGFRAAVSADQDASQIDDMLGTTQCAQILSAPFRERGSAASPSP